MYSKFLFTITYLKLNVIPISIVVLFDLQIQFIVVQSFLTYVHKYLTNNVVIIPHIKSFSLSENIRKSHNFLLQTLAYIYKH